MSGEGFELVRGATERATILLGGAEQLLRGTRRLPHEQAVFDRRVLALRSVLPPDVFERAWQKGMSFSFDELLDFALGG